MWERMNIKGRLYRLIMKVAHKYHWHYAPPIYPEGNTQLWCKWCGFSATIKTRKPYDEHTQEVSLPVMKG